VCFSQVPDAIFVFAIAFRELCRHDVRPGSGVKTARRAILYGLPEMELVYLPLRGPCGPAQPLTDSGTKASECAILPLIWEGGHEAARIHSRAWKRGSVAGNHARAAGCDAGNRIP
jgi:hypothetical protein